MTITKLEELNRDHHRRMTLEHERQVKTNTCGHFAGKDEDSRAALARAMLGCETRFSMRRPGVAEVLELGAGTGRDKSFLEEFFHARYTGIEVVPEVAARIANQNVHCMAVEELPDEWAGRFDYIYSRHVMEHVIDLDRALSRIKHVLAPNGVIGAVTPHFFPDPEPAHLTKLKVQQWIAAYKRAGLSPMYAMVETHAVAEAHLVVIHEGWRAPSPSPTFVYRGKTHVYFDHPYNETIKNERAVEIPIVVGIVQGLAAQSVLEVGNVLSHYPGQFDVARRVVDKYETAPGVENIDVLDARGEHDLIVSISTLEHVGRDEKPRDDDKAVRAVEHLRGLLSETGKLVFTVPMGYNPALDEYVLDCPTASDITFMRRTSAANHWEETGSANAASALYGRPFVCANVIAVCVMGRP